MRFGLSRTGSEYSDSEHEQEAEERDPVIPLDRTSSSSSTTSLKRSTKNLPTRRPTTTSKLGSFELPNLEKCSYRTRKTPLLSLSDSEDDDEEGDVLAEGTSEESEVDSEEEEWPVGPRGSVGLRGKIDRKGKGKATSFVHPEIDELDQWNDQSRQQSWANANRTFKLSLARSISLSPPPRSSSASAAVDITSIDSLLSQLQLEQTRSTQLLVSAFERRNKSLWDSIESSIQTAEAEERALQAKRLKELEQEKKAQEMRALELKRLEEEKRKEEERRRVEEVEKEKERERVEKEKKEMEEKARELEKKNSAISGKTSGEGSPKGEFEKWSNKMTYIKEKILPVVSQNPTLRKSCFQAKRSITPKIGQLTSSLSAITRIITQLDELLVSVKSSGSEEAYVWTLNHLSKSLIKQAETEVTAKLGTAYPLGRVVVGLLLRGHQELGEVLMARLVKKCFWITGYWPSKQPGQSEESYQKTLGYLSPSSSESSVQYSERMAGLVSLYASILQSSPLEPPQSLPSLSPSSKETLSLIPAHFRPSAGWRWLILLLRPPLVSLEPTPLLLTQFLQIAGPTLLSTFGRQFKKFLEVLLREGVREKKAGFSEEKSRASVVRLELWLEEWEKAGGGVIQEVEGRRCDE
ncbi:uncharacterized protein JCM6883_007095 [Sporobolomyces salmoneus]|uniref:uncharacterized protein n=1 Tax=Sporobolomyces salmoneus TaxID=183962 RepID=UPI003179E35A